jgi:hypothetical protein
MPLKVIWWPSSSFVSRKVEVITGRLGWFKIRHEVCPQNIYSIIPFFVFLKTEIAFRKTISTITSHLLQIKQSIEPNYM